MRLSYLTQGLAQAAADSIHARMIASDPAYAASVSSGQTTAWATPYLDVDLWYVNCKARVSAVLTIQEQSDMKPYKTAG